MKSFLSYINEKSRNISFMIPHILALGIFIASNGLCFGDDVKPLEIGAKAPFFDLPGTDGRNHNLQDYDEYEVLAIVFTCNHCPTAQAYEQRLIDLANDYANRSFALVAISPNDPIAVRLDELGYTDLNDSLEEMIIRANERGFPFDYLYDGESQDIVRAYGPLATPHVFVFDQTRVLRFQGRIDDSEKPEGVVEQNTRLAIDAIFLNEEIEVETTKIFGCTIKWADKRDQAKEYRARWDTEKAELEMLSLEGMKKIMSNDTPNLRLVNFWATWCGPCVTEFPALVDINRMYRGREFEMVTVSSDAPERKDFVHAFLNKRAASMSNYLYEGTNHYDLVEAADADWPGPLPYTALVAPGGEIIFRQLGEIDPQGLKRAVVGYLGRVY